MKSRRRQSRPREVFLSHSSRDRHVATRIAEVLRHHGIPVWYSRTHLRGAQQWHDEIGDALNRCDWFIVLLSKSAIGSRWVKHELVFALDSEGYENKVLPGENPRMRSSAAFLDAEEFSNHRLHGWLRQRFPRITTHLANSAPTIRRQVMPPAFEPCS